MGAIDARTDEIGWHKVGGELDAVKRAAEDIGDGADRESLGEARDAFDEQVPAGEEGDEHTFEQDLLADDDAPRFEEGLLEALARQFWLDEPVGVHFQLVHLVTPR